MKEEASIPAPLRQMHRASHALYLLFNWACIIVYAYQVYLWIRQGFWTKIPSTVLLPGLAAWTIPAGSGPIVRVFFWTCHVELAYTLCAVAMVFYALRRMA